MFPTSKPKFVLAVMLDEPKNSKDYIYQYPGTNNPGSFDISTTAPDGTIIGNWDTGK